MHETVRSWLEHLASVAGLTILELAFDATVILAIAGLVVLGLRRASASMRHRAWTAAIVCLLILPLGRWLLPEAPFGLGIAPPLPAAAEPSAIASAQPDLGATSAHSWPLSEAAPEGESTEEESAQPLPAPQVGALTDTRGQGYSIPWLAACVLVWAVGVGLGLISFTRSLAAARRLVRSGEPVRDPAWGRLASELGARLGLRQRVALVASVQAGVPLTAGWLRPTIVVPAGCDAWPDERRRVVLAHELVHVARGDVLWQMAARLACAVYWCHPLVWLAAWRLRVEREIACDDAVLSLGANPSRYASQLVDVASSLAGPACLPSTAVATVTGNSLEKRIRSILHPALCRKPVGRPAACVLAAGAGVALLLAALISPVATPSRAPGEALQDQPARVEPEHRPSDAPAAAPAEPGSDTTLKEAVVSFNQKAAEYFSELETHPGSPWTKDQRPSKLLTEDEVVAAIRAWNREEVEVSDETYRIYQKIDDSGVLPPNAKLEFHRHWYHLDEQDEYDYLVWRIDLLVMTGKNTGYGFRIRDEKLDRRYSRAPSPGYSWIIGPISAQRLPKSQWASAILILEEDKDGALIVTAAWPHQREMRDHRVVALGEKTDRYVLDRRFGGGATPTFGMQRFRLDPSVLPASKVQHVGLEARSDEGIRRGSETSAPEQPRVVLQGTVIDPEGKPAAGAKVIGIPISDRRHADLKVTTDEQGRFRQEHPPEKTFFYAETSDGRLKGVVEMPAGQKDVTIPVQPVASARGRLVDAAGEPIPDRRIEYGIRIELPRGGLQHRHGGKTKTDAAGRFVLTGLVAGQEYHLQLPLHDEDDPLDDWSWRDVGTFTAQGPATTDVGDFKYRPPRRSPPIRGGAPAAPQGARRPVNR